MFQNKQKCKVPLINAIHHNVRRRQKQTDQGAGVVSLIGQTKLILIVHECVHLGTKAGY